MGLGTTTSRTLVAIAACGCAIAALMSPAEAAPDERATLGAFSPPFSEPTIEGHETDEKCIEHSHDGGEPVLECKPAAGSIATLSNGRILYFNALEGTENIQNGTAAEFGHVSVNDQTRVLDLTGPTWAEPNPVEGGANPDGYETSPIVPGASSAETYNDGALFCSDLSFLPDGRILAAGGTAYYDEPGAEGVPYGVAELEGLRNSRIYDPQSNTWSQTGEMNFGRWYPTMVTLGDGTTFIASGVRKLIKPIYPDAPQDSGRNVVQTETYDPATGEWTYNGASADRSLPLYPRLHLLPNGHVFYNAAGQAFNPSGQSYDEPLWNLTGSYDPAAKEWMDLGLAGAGTLTPGFRGSSFSIMLPLQPEADGTYTKAEFLSAGGVLGTTPGSYVAIPTSAITTVDTADGNAVTTAPTANLNESRWYSTAIALPTGQVLAFSGANRDEVVGPGTGNAAKTVEMFDPATGEWSRMATATQERTYHNTATLLPDGRVLVGGHAPIPTLYSAHMTLPGGFSPNEGRDPTFEIYSPPYLFWGPRPGITRVDHDIDYGDSMRIVTNTPASQVDSVVLVRNPSLTHLTDGDQRTVVLPITARQGRSITVAAPPSGTVAPPGPYMLFVNSKSERGSIPSIAEQVSLGV
jgi:hypothetical protein